MNAQAACVCLIDMYHTYFPCNTLLTQGLNDSFLSPSPKNFLYCSDSILSLFVSSSLQTLSLLTNPGRMTMRMERRNFPLWPVAWFLSPCCPWRRMTTRMKGRQDKRPPHPLFGPTLTFWLNAFSTLERTVPRGSSIRTQTPPHPPKHRGTVMRRGRV